MRFIENAIRGEDIGKQTPRAFVEYDRKSKLNAHHFEFTVANSFQDLTRKTLFITKWYQLLIHAKALMKSKKLLVCIHVNLYFVKIKI